MRILILGGYGSFGGRLAELLSDIPEMELIIAGRSHEKAQAFCAALPGYAKSRPQQLDRKDLAKHLPDIAPSLVVDASGPFQNYGSDKYAVVEACLKQRIDYLDLADSADFVTGISKFDQTAKEAGVTILSGLSSFPTLSTAVLDDISKRMSPTNIVIGLAPSPYAGIGLNVVRAILAYTGSRIKLWRDGAFETGIGLGESRRLTVAVPGLKPLRNLRFSLIEVPDLRLLPHLFPTLQSIWVGAGTQPTYLLRLLNVLATFRARLKIPSFAPFARPSHAVMQALRSGEHRGGMVVQVKGKSGKVILEESWHLLAEGDDGPFIPIMPCNIIIRKMLVGKTLAKGARSANGTLTLADFNEQFSKRSIVTGFRTSADDSYSVFPSVLGNTFIKLPPLVQDLHTTSGRHVWSGLAGVKRGPGILANLVCKIFRLPPESESTAISVQIERQDDSEIWTRTFGSNTFHTVLSAGKGVNKYLVVEKFGPIRIAMALVLEDDKLVMIPRNWTFGPIPMPKTLIPSGRIFETERAGKFVFDVEIKAPLLGLLVAYKGELEKQS